MRLQPHQLKAMSAHQKAFQTLDGFVPPAPLPKKKRTYEESENQIALFQWWATHCQSFGVAECLLFAVPNGSALGTGKEDWQVKQRTIRGKRLKAEGLKPGTPDVFLAVPGSEIVRDHARKEAFFGKRYGLFIEMKTTTGKISPEQQAFFGFAISRGYRCAVCRSAEEAIKTITEYLK